ncbi:MAG TPA: Rrf2 family transcriptional regulator [Bryobacteraceae bacterium]|nr:Rrf2 family transcriptional regulator [Bryobacteraceae bacterium]
MHISVKGEYALHALIDLALEQPGEPVKIAEIARRQKIPQKFLELILAGLKQGGFVESRRGAEGGYMLARPADAITLGDVLRFVEGPRAANRPAGARSRRPGSAATADADDPFSGVWQRVDQAVSEILDKTTLQDVQRDWTEKRNKFVLNWEI